MSDRARLRLVITFLIIQVTGLIFQVAAIQYQIADMDRRFPGWDQEDFRWEREGGVMGGWITRAGRMLPRIPILGPK